MKYVTITIHAAFTDDVTDEEIQTIASHAYVQVQEPDSTGEGDQTLTGAQYTPAGLDVRIEGMGQMLSSDVSRWEQARHAIATEIIRRERLDAGQPSSSWFDPIDPETLHHYQENL